MIYASSFQLLHADLCIPFRSSSFLLFFSSNFWFAAIFVWRKVDAHITIMWNVKLPEMWPYEIVRKYLFQTTKYLATWYGFIMNTLLFTVPFFSSYMEYCRIWMWQCCLVLAKLCVINSYKCGLLVVNEALVYHQDRFQDHFFLKSPIILLKKTN